MTNQEKFFLLVVLIVSGAGATVYVQNAKNNSSINEKVQSQTQIQDIKDTTNTVDTTSNSEVALKRSTNTNIQDGNSIPTAQTVKTTEVQNTTNNQPTSVVTNPETPAQKSTKQTKVSYTVPGGDVEVVIIKVTLSNKIISDISFSMVPTNRESEEYYARFKNSFPKSQLVGKELGNVSLSRVGGASLTTNAFNKALSQL